MGINLSCIKKYEKAYEGLQATISPIEFTPDSPYYHKEEWREVLPMFVPGVLPATYWVSNYGRVYTKLKSPIYPNGGIMAHSINQRGYHQINLKTSDGGKVCVKISRLVMLHFRFVPGCHLLEVDHLDGNKDNNYLWNFEWVTPSVNTHRAIKNHLRPISCNTGYYREDVTFLSDEKARELFYRNLNGEDVDMLSKEYNVTTLYISSLARGIIRPLYIRGVFKKFKE